MKKSLVAIVLFMMVFITACGSKSSVVGTWTLEKIVHDGTTYTLDEIKALGSDAVGSEVMSMLDTTIVIKESDSSDSGSAFLSSAGQTVMVDWSLEGDKIKIGVQECEIDGNYIVISPNDDSKMYLKKTSDSQDITQISEGTDDGQDNSSESSTDGGSDDQINDTDTTSGDSYESSSDYDTILANATSAVEQGVADITNEWETLKSNIDSYDAYVSYSSDIEGFYKEILEKNSELCTVAYKAALDYAKAIAASGDDDSDKYKKSKDIDKEIYDDICDIINNGIYEDLFDDMNKQLYEGVLDDSDESGVSYDEWYDTVSDEYEQWYDARSDVYEEWYDSKSDIYSFYYDVASEFYSGDSDRAQKKIDDFEEDIQKRENS